MRFRSAITASSFRDQLIAAPLKLKRRDLGAALESAFRDQLIAAPLKQFSLITLLTEVYHFPRSVDRGPIEAWAPQPPAGPCPESFRDQLIAAPLKRCQCRPSRLRGRPFRDQLIAAPLKLLTSASVRLRKAMESILLRERDCIYANLLDPWRGTQHRRIAYEAGPATAFPTTRPTPTGKPKSSCVPRDFPSNLRFRARGLESPTPGSGSSRPESAPFGWLPGAMSKAPSALMIGSPSAWVGCLRGLRWAMLRDLHSYDEIEQELCRRDLHPVGARPLRRL